MEQVFGMQAELVVGSLIGILLINIVLVLVLWARLGKLRKSYTRMMNGDSGMNMEDVIVTLQDKINVLISSGDQHSKKLKQLEQHMRTMKSLVGVHRYNAFSSQGSDLSFSAAIVDEAGNGVVLSGIHGREETYIYAKPLEKKDSKYALSPEEKEAINLALTSGKVQSASSE